MRHISFYLKNIAEDIQKRAGLVSQKQADQLAFDEALRVVRLERHSEEKLQKALEFWQAYRPVNNFTEQLRGQSITSLKARLLVIQSDKVVSPPR